MTWYGTVLWVHVVAGIALVGGGIFSLATHRLARRARTVDGMRSHVAFLATFTKASGPVAVVVVAAGLYLAFAGGWWGRGWPVVSLVMFAIVGLAATVVEDPRVAALASHLETVPDGPVPPDVHAALDDRAWVLVGWMITGTDLAIVAMMTNKPGWTGAIATSLVGVAAGVAVGSWAGRRVRGAPKAPAIGT